MIKNDEWSVAVPVIPDKIKKIISKPSSYGYEYLPAYRVFKEQFKGCLRALKIDDLALNDNVSLSIDFYTENERQFFDIFEIVKLLVNNCVINRFNQIKECHIKYCEMYPEKCIITIRRCNEK
jgi:hypothetical protein